MKFSHFTIVALLLAVGVSLILWRNAELGVPLQPGANSSAFEIEATIHGEVAGIAPRVSLRLPRELPRHRRTRESLSGDRFSVSTITLDNVRSAVWSGKKLEPGSFAVSYSLTVENRPEPKAVLWKLPKNYRFIRLHESAESTIRKLVGRAKKSSRDPFEQVEWIIKELDSSKTASATLFGGREPTKRQFAKMAARVVTAAGIPSRVVYGLELSEPQRKTPLVYWIECYLNDRAVGYDLARRVWEIPSNYLRWGDGGTTPVKAESVDSLKLYFSVNPVIHLSQASEEYPNLSENSIIALFSVSRLPVGLRTVYQVLLLLPVAALVIAVLRNVIGLKMFGTFMPALIALSFRETELMWGVILFSAVSVLGLLFHFMFGRLKLLLVPRLAATLTVVVMLFLAISLTSDYFAFDRGLSVALFPIVIVTMVIERISVVWDELGPPQAIMQGVTSLITASIAYLVIRDDYVAYFFVAFPEALLIVLAGLIIVGRYTGFRLTELYRFRALWRGASIDTER